MCDYDTDIDTCFSLSSQSDCASVTADVDAGSNGGSLTQVRGTSTGGHCSDGVANGQSGSATDSVSTNNVNVSSVVSGTAHGITGQSLQTSTSASGTLQTSANDIGNIIKPGMSPQEVAREIEKLSMGEKYTLLKNHKKPPHSHIFPTTYIGGCNHSFRVSWLNDHPWMVYSEALDGAFCIPCALFDKNHAGTRKTFVVSPFRLWHKKTQKCKDHELTQYHQKALQLSHDFIRSVESPETSVVALIDTRRAANIERNRHILKCVADVILHCGKQCVALRGSVEGIDVPGNPGNFLSLLKLIAKYDEVLYNHLHSPAMKCVTFMSPQTQNELIEVIAKHIILHDIVNEIKQAKYYSIMADEVTSHNTEQLAFCVRFVDSKSNIREEFLAFVKLERITGEFIAGAILQLLVELGIPVEDMRGQGYDGATNISSQRVGVNARLRELEQSPLATYVHCSGHCLNLVISHSCALPEVRNVVDRLKHCCRFFLLSPKRNGLLELIVKNKMVHDVARRKALLDLCKTRWAERQNAYRHFYQAYVYIVEALEMIGYGKHIEVHGDLYHDWDTASRSEAQQILVSITSFEFIVVFLTMYQYLSHLSGVTVQLQSTTLDIIEAYGMIDEIKAVYKAERQNVDNSFQVIYNQSLAMAEKVGITPLMPRVASRQQHCSNIAAESVSDYFKKNMVIPFLDHIVVDLDHSSLHLQ